MPPPSTMVINLGTLGTQLRHALRNLCETVLVPLGLFYLVLTLSGLTGALFAALGWGLAAIGWRVARRTPLPTVLILTTVLLVVRTVVGYATGSTFWYFVQPTLGNFLIGAVLVASVGLRRPVLARLADDFCAFPAEFTGHPRVQRFFRRVSLLWAVVFLANGAATLWVLARATLEEFLLVTTIGKWLLFGLTAAASLVWLRRELRGGGIHLHLRPRPSLIPT